MESARASVIIFNLSRGRSLAVKLKPPPEPYMQDRHD